MSTHLSASSSSSPSSSITSAFFTPLPSSPKTFSEGKPSGQSKLQKIQKLLHHVLPQAGEETQKKSKKKRETLHQLAREGRAKEIKKLLKKGRVDINQRDPRFQTTALYLACQHGHLEVVKVLLDHPSLDVNTEVGDQEGTKVWVKNPGKPWEGKSEKGGYLGGGMLITVKAAELRGIVDDSRLPSWTYLTPLHVACARGYSEIVQLLLSHPKIEANLISNKLTPLMAAIKNGQHHLLPLLLPFLEDINRSPGQRLPPPLHFACQGGNPEVVRVLLRQSDVIKNLPFRGFSPVAMAERRGYHEVVALFEEHSSSA